MRSLLFLLLLCSVSAFSQKSQSRVYKFTRNSVKPIKDGSKVVGYYFFYTKEKAGFREKVYGLTVFDGSLEPVSENEIVESKNRSLLSAESNGEYFCFHFHNSPKGISELVIYDKQLNEVGTFVHQGEKNDLGLATHSLVALRNTGFALYGTNKKKAEVIAFSNQGIEQWRAGAANPDKYKIEGLTPLACTERYVVFNQVLMKSMMKYRDIQGSVRILDTQTGRELFFLKSEGKVGKINFESFTELSDGFLLTGSYFTEGVSKTGLAVVKLDAGGKIEMEKYIDLGEAATRAIDAYTRNNFKDRSVFILETIQRLSGDIVLVTQIYDKKNLYDVALFELNSGLEVKDIKLMNRKPEDISGFYSSLMNEAQFGAALKLLGGANYCFTMAEDDGSEFQSVFLDENHKKGDSQLKVVGYSGKKFVTNSIRLATEPTMRFIFPAKPGQVALFEFFESEKRVTFRLQGL